MSWSSAGPVGHWGAYGHPAGLPRATDSSLTGTEGDWQGWSSHGEAKGGAAACRGKAEPIIISSLLVLGLASVGLPIYCRFLIFHYLFQNCCS